MTENTGVDIVLQSLGGFGRFQKINIACLSLIAFLCAISELGYVFTAGRLKHRCLISECENGGSAFEQSWLSNMIPKTESGEYQSCLRFNSTLDGDCRGSTTNYTYECDNYIYSTDEWTIAREDWGIHCHGDRWKLTMVGSINNAAQVLGGLYMGYISDMFGRKRTTLTWALLVVVIGIIKSFSVNYIMMVVLEFLEAQMSVFLFNGPLVIALEIVAPSKRVLVGSILCVAYPCGEIILCLAQWLTLDWRTTIRILYPPFLLLVLFFWTLPESIRWLLINHRTKDAVEELKRMARINGKPFLDENVSIIELEMQKISEEEKTKKSNNTLLLSLMKSSRMRNRFIACFFLWCVNTFIYFGITLNSVNIHEDKFLNFALTAMIEIPSYLSAIFIVDRIGRRICQSSSLLICGLACLLFAFIPQENSWSWVRLVLYLMGKFSSSFSYIVIEVYTTEMFPTPVRGSIICWMLAGGKLSSILAPQTPLLSDIYEQLPLILFGGLALGAALLALTLPETLNATLPDTIQQAEELGKKKSKL